MEEPKKIPGYILDKKYGKGGMATLYKGTQTSLNRTVAIKELHGFLNEEGDFKVRFKREADVLSKLEHSNIVRIYEYVQAHGSLFIIMEFVDGVDLKAVIKNVGGKIPEQIALMFIYFIFKGLNYAHNQGVIHRDIKPGNVLISKNGFVKIVDFGLAHSEDAANLTMTGTLMGTPAYMSPEQARGETLDCQSDIFSTGIMLYELLTGQKPYGDTNNYMSIIAKILSPDTVPVPTISEPFGEGAVRIYQKMVDKNKEKRYQNTDEVISDIEDYFSNFGISPSENIIRNYLKSVNYYWDELKKEIIKKELKLGVENFEKGKPGYSNAVMNFQKVLKWDKDNAQAKAYLEKLDSFISSGKFPLIPVAGAFIVMLSILLYFFVFRVKTVLTIDFHPPDAQVILDGRTLEGTSPVSRRIKPGKYKIEIEKDYFIKRDLDIDIKKGEKKSVSVNLEKINYQISEFRITPEDALLYINDELFEERKFNMNLGNHDIEVKKEGYFSEKINEQIYEGGRKIYKIELKKSRDIFTINTQPAGADVFLNKKRLGKSPLESMINYGNNEIRISLKGYNDIYRVMEFNDKIKRDLDFTMEKFVERYGTLYISVSNPQNAEIFINGKKIGMVPIRPQTLTVGKHVLEVKAGNYETMREEINVKEGENRLSYSLQKAFGYLRIKVSPWANVFVNGEKKGVTPIARPMELPIGVHTLKLENPECRIHEQKIEIKSDQTLELDIRLLFK